MAFRYCFSQAEPIRIIIRPERAPMVSTVWINSIILCSFLKVSIC